MEKHPKIIIDRCHICDCNILETDLYEFDKTEGYAQHIRCRHGKIQ